MLNYILMGLIVSTVSMSMLLVFVIAFLMINGFTLYEFARGLNVSKVIDMFLPSFI